VLHGQAMMLILVGREHLDLLAGEIITLEAVVIALISCTG
jgi:hypothetical protein